MHCLELKRIGKSLTRGPGSLAIWCRRKWFPHVVAYTIEEALEALESWGALA